MLKTYEEARGVRCCGPEGCGREEERGAWPTPTRLCIASDCMAWRWYDPERKEVVEAFQRTPHEDEYRFLKNDHRPQNDWALPEAEWSDKARAWFERAKAFGRTMKPPSHMPEGRLRVSALPGRSLFEWRQKQRIEANTERRGWCGYAGAPQVPIEPYVEPEPTERSTTDDDIPF